jgi:hypothetical protein
MKQDLLELVQPALEFLNNLRGVGIGLSYRAGIFKQSMGARNRVGIGPPGYSFFGIKNTGSGSKNSGSVQNAHDGLIEGSWY